MDGISSCLISVIIPVYNGQLTIEETVKSVLNQTFTDFELIVINDGSTDSTLDILKKFHDNRIIIYSYPNAGLSASRNRGIKLARGEFISFIDADDLWSSDKLKNQLESLRENPEAAVAYSWTSFIDKSGNTLDYGIQYTVNGYVFQDLLTFFFIGSGSNALIRKKVFNEVGQFDETLTSAEDWDMFLRIAARYHFASVPAPQIFYRLIDNSMSTNVIRQEKECLKVLERVFIQEPGKSLLHLKRHTYANLYIYLTALALRGVPDKLKGLIATRFLWRSIAYDLLILRQGKLVATLLVKILTILLLPPQQAQSLRGMMKSFVNHLNQHSLM
jgi:glycosyltransferase involved in cell wall biosynthesis